jgi:non-specific serine/threonine protein kinase/serine/threonine-protein kinase
MGPSETAGTVIGRYHLLQKIGEGGMGEVWLAEQKEPVRRRVALKLVKAGMNTREVIARFESERQALALMDHPAIAKVFDAGSTVEGAPYFVMEYVAGVPITTYCDNHRLNTRARLELFVHVCEGVQHAHQKAIIHRDLKPSNILVTEVDGNPAPKIIDFGIAKALTQKLSADTMFTRLGALLGTPEYMSPEQAGTSGEDIDTRTDVYSLGIIFYELLAGASPLELKKIAFDEFLRRLREDDPPKPSTKIRMHDQATSTAVAHKRQTEPGTLARQIRGDLDAIALKALEKDRSRRYGSPSDFAADIGRYLRNEAVLAVAPSAAYRARKFARRYRAALATVCAFVLVLAAAAAISIRQSVRANREAAVAQAVNDFLRNDLLAQASSSKQYGAGAKPDPDLKVRTALDRAAAKVAEKFEQQPAVEAAIRDTIGRTYVDLGLYAGAAKQLERVLTLNRLMLGPENPETLRATNALAMTAIHTAAFAEAEKLEKPSLGIQERVLGSGHPETLNAMNVLANAYLGENRFAEAEKVFRQLLPRLRANDPLRSRALNNLGVVYDETGRRPEALSYYKEAYLAAQHQFGAEHPLTLTYMKNVGGAYEELGDYAQGEAITSQVMEIERRALGPEHPETLITDVNLAEMYLNEGKFAQAETLGGEALQALQRVLGPEHQSTLITARNLAFCQAVRHEFVIAEPALLRVLETERRVLGEDNRSTVDAEVALVYLHQQQGRYAQAEKYARDVLLRVRRTQGADSADTMAAADDLAFSLQSQESFTESEALAREALATETKLRPDSWQRFRAETLLGAALAGEKKYAEAEPMLLDGYQGLLARKEHVEVWNWDQIDHAGGWIAGLYQYWGKPEKAAEWRARLKSDRAGNMKP